MKRLLHEEAIEQYAQPQIINSDQGSQFTSAQYIGLLKERDKSIASNMDGKGRALDNIFIERFWKSIKYECIYLHAFEYGVALYDGLYKYKHFYTMNASINRWNICHRLVAINERFNGLPTNKQI